MSGGMIEANNNVAFSQGVNNCITNHSAGFSTLEENL